MPELRQLPQTRFDAADLRSGREIAVRRAQAGQHTLLVMPARPGKSLPFQLAPLLLPGLTLVISPRLAWMKALVDGAAERGLSATYISRNLPPHEAANRLRAVREGHIKTLYITPERLRSRKFTAMLARLKISLLVLDEAHCISQLSHDYWPDCGQIGPIWQAMGRPPLLATTAGATPRVQSDVLNILDVEKARILVTGFNRPNLTYSVKYAPDEAAKLQILQDVLLKTGGQAIVYTATRRNADGVADFVRRTLGRAASAYHAGLDRNVRDRVWNEFMAGRLQAVVATNAFDAVETRPEVRAVIHYNLPACLETYDHQAGRAGGDGLPARCVLLFAPADQALQEWLIRTDTPTRDDLLRVYNLLAQTARAGEVYAVQDELAATSGLHPLKLRVTLDELEQAGSIFHLGNEANVCHWRVLPLKPGALESGAEAVAARRENRSRLLARMVAFAHTDQCRRRFLLDYFGDPGRADAPDCCDNHRAGQRVTALPKAETPEQWQPLIVLETVRSLYRPVGRNRLSQILKGSRARQVKGFGYDRHKFYGKLEHLSRQQVTGLIDALISGGYLRLGGGKFPVLKLTPLGAQALDNRAAVPVDLPSVGSEPPSRTGLRVQDAQAATAPVEDVREQAPPAEAEAPVSPPDSVQALRAVIADLPGRLTPEGVSLLLTGPSEEIAKVGDHDLYGSLHGKVSPQTLAALVQEMLNREELILTPQGRLRPGV
ncbi:MAG: RecQ family ATP-dependent DNA helicase [Anaerolineae bacterium]